VTVSPLMKKRKRRLDYRSQMNFFLQQKGCEAEANRQPKPKPKPKMKIIGKRFMILAVQRKRKS